MPLTILSGCSITDTVFTLDARICGEEITWNATRLQQDAAIGVFGKPWLFDMNQLPPMGAEDRANVDWDKARMISRHSEVMASPVIAIGNGVPGSIFCFVDGTHRLCARQLVGLRDFESYIVPAEVERHYRIVEKKL